MDREGKKTLVWKRNAGILLGLAAIVIKVWSAAHPEWVERIYSRGLFLGIRWMAGHLLGWVPFPLIYIVFASLVIWFVIRVKQMPHVKRWTRNGLAAGFLGVLNFSGWVIFLFFFLWGFNYNRVPVETQLALKPKPLSKPELQREFEAETAAIIQKRKEIPNLGEREISHYDLPAQLESDLRGELEDLLRENGFPVVGLVRGRLLFPKGILLRFSTAGVYFPFTAEGHIDPGLHPVQWPYVLGHELAHGYGFGDEGTCNFWAYLVCQRSKDPLVAYTGHLAYWRTLARAFRFYEPEKFRELRVQLPTGIQADLDGINREMERYPDLAPRLQYQVYDNYLKSQGIREGMLNYDRVIMLVRAWKRLKKG